MLATTRKRRQEMERRAKHLRPQPRLRISREQLRNAPKYCTDPKGCARPGEPNPLCPKCDAQWILLCEAIEANEL